MAYQDLWNELIYNIPSLSAFEAQRFVNRAWREIRQMKSWSFLLADGHLIVPEPITAGTVSVTKFSKNVTPDATALAAFNAAGTHPLIGDRQFRVSAGSRIYNIESWNGTTLVLEEEYQEDTNAATAYQVFSCYFRPPSDDFIRFISIRDLITNYYIRLNYVQQEIDRIDPQRNTSGDPLYIVSYKTLASGVPLFELWPTPQSARTYQVLYQKRGTDFVSATETVPSVVPEHLLLDKALYYAYRWAEGAKGTHKELLGTDWRYLAAESNRNFMEGIRKAIREDEDTYLQTLRTHDRNMEFLTPIDANYAQNHIVDWA